MTIQNVFERLEHIDREAVRLSREAGFSQDECLGEEVCHLPDICEDAFLRDNAEEILQALGQIHLILRYLKTPLHGEHTLRRLPNGRFGYCNGKETRVFTSGDSLEAKICDTCGSPRWVVSIIEHDGKDYYLAGFHSIPLGGLTVRERW